MRRVAHEIGSQSLVAVCWVLMPQSTAALDRAHQEAIWGRVDMAAAIDCTAIAIVGGSAERETRGRSQQSPTITEPSLPLHVPQALFVAPPTDDATMGPSTDSTDSVTVPAPAPVVVHSLPLDNNVPNAVTYFC